MPTVPSATFTYEAADGLAVVAYRWDAVGSPAGAVQLTHGMGEHVRRYEEVAQAFAARGSSCTGRTTAGTVQPPVPPRSSGTWARAAGPGWSTTSAGWPR